MCLCTWIPGWPLSCTQRLVLRSITQEMNDQLGNNNNNNNNNNNILSSLFGALCTWRYGLHSVWDLGMISREKCFPLQHLHKRVQAKNQFSRVGCEYDRLFLVSKLGYESPWYSVTIHIKLIVWHLSSEKKSWLFNLCRDITVQICMLPCTFVSLCESPMFNQLAGMG